MADGQNTSYKSEIFAKIGDQARLHPIYTAFVPIIAVTLMMVAMGVAMVPIRLLPVLGSLPCDLNWFICWWPSLTLCLWQFWPRRKSCGNGSNWSIMLFGLALGRR